MSHLPRVAVVTSTAASAIWSVAGTRPISAQQSAIDSDQVVVQARAQLEAAQAAAHQAAADLERSTEERAAVVAKIADEQARISVLDQQRAQLQAQHDELLAEVRARARALYEHGGTISAAETVLSGRGSMLDAARRAELGDAAARADQETVRQLTRSQHDLAAVQDGLRRDQSDLQTQQAALDALVDQLHTQQGLLDQRVAAANVALEHARVIGALHAAGDPVFGPSTLTAAQIVAWYHAQPYRPRLSGTTVDDLVPIFLQEATDENVRGDVAFAQAIVETGGFSSVPSNNFSGIGWCDTCTRGIAFPTPQDGIRAQVQLLVNYANPYSQATQLHHPLSPYLYDPNPAIAAHEFDSFYAKGWAPTWRDMGHGNWATDPNYSSKVLAVYHAMITYAQAG
jgi:peptidoglycan hydrolase CwlO-like protein